VTRRLGKKSPKNFKSSQNSCQEKKSTSNLYLKVQNHFLNLKNSNNKQCFQTAYLGEIEKLFAQAKVSPKCHHFFGYFIFTKNHSAPKSGPIVARLPNLVTLLLKHIEILKIICTEESRILFTKLHFIITFKWDQ
jgi:hypothetical protein